MGSNTTFAKIKPLLPEKLDFKTELRCVLYVDERVIHRKVKKYSLASVTSTTQCSRAPFVDRVGVLSHIAHRAQHIVALLRRCIAHSHIIERSRYPLHAGSNTLATTVRVLWTYSIQGRTSSVFSLQAWHYVQQIWACCFYVVALMSVAVIILGL